MPIFEYVCKKCDHRFETIVHGSQVAVCPSCSSKKLEKQLSVFAVSGADAGSARVSNREPMGSCGTCGDPRGPGSCSIN